MTDPGAVHRLRKELGLSQQALAYKIDCSLSSVSRWDRGYTVGPRFALARLRDLAAKHNHRDLAVVFAEELASRQVITFSSPELAIELHAAWQGYVKLFGEPPHGTLPQIKALVTMMGAFINCADAQ